MLALRNEQNITSGTSKISENLLPSGIDLQKESHGTANTPKKCGRISPQKSIHVLSAEKVL